MDTNFLHNKLEAFQANILRDVQNRISEMMDNALQELQNHEFKIQEFRNFAKPKSNIWTNRCHSTATSLSTHKNAIAKESNEKQTSNASNTDVFRRDTIKKFHHRSFPDKVFQIRDSYLTVLSEVDHIKAIYHIFYIILLIFFLNSIIHDYFVKGSISFGLTPFKKGFAKIHYVLGIWLIQKTFVCSIYYALKVWWNIRSRLNNQTSLQRTWSWSCVMVYITTQVIFLYIAAQLCSKLDLPFVTAIVLLLESLRMLMMMHGYVRTICSRVLQGKWNVDNGIHCAGIPPFHKYFYYLFAPTLIYRDNYPRTSSIRWKFAAARFLEIVAVAFLASFFFERFFIPNFENFGREEITPASISDKYFSMCVPCITLIITFFYLFFHSWHNFTAELLRFGDRMFYRDWWTAGNFDAFYRNWNVIVHDWLYEYFYKDFCNYIFRGSKLASSLLVFLLSSLFHEYFLGYALQVFLPAMFIQFFFCGVLFMFLTRVVPKNVGNIILWFGLIIGSALMMSLYAMEYFASQNCPKETYQSWKDSLVPHVWSCYMK